MSVYEEERVEKDPLDEGICSYKQTIQTKNCEEMVDFFHRRRISSPERQESMVSLAIIDGNETDSARRSGQQFDSLREQTKRFSRLLSRRTELHTLQPSGPKNSLDQSSEILSDPQFSERSIFGLKGPQCADEHGGDYQYRSHTALRASLGSLIIFSSLVLTHQSSLGVVWIGNIFMHSNLNDSFGESLNSVIGSGRSVVLTTAMSWPVANFMSKLTTTQSATILPLIAFCLSFLIMTCPQLTSKNLMILVMFVVIAAPVREQIYWWMPLGYLGTYLVGMTVALLVNAFNSALASSHRSLSRLQKDLTMLLIQCKAYSDNLVTAPEISRAAAASIEMIYTRIDSTVKKLRAKLPATTLELSIRCKYSAAKDLSEWVLQTERLLAPLKSLRTALMQRVIGEEQLSSSEALKEAKEVIGREVGPARDRMVDAMISSVAVCHAMCDPAARRRNVVLPDVKSELETSINECRRAFHWSMLKATDRLVNCIDPEVNVPIFAHMTRRMVAFHALFELGDSFRVYLQDHSWEVEKDEEEYFVKDMQHLRGSKRCLLTTSVANGFDSFLRFVELQWLWRNPDSFRLALKTGVGMALASLFIAIPYLWNISEPFGVWPGLTIASVNLNNTGSSFQKASDRLSGTLFAAAYALILSDLFPGNMDLVKIPGIAFFTFVVIYLRNADHAYRYTYAATSIGSMLYGSIKNDFKIAEYIPKRIELIFIGIVLFSLIELLLFPRSSRKIVESLGFRFFLSMQDYLKQAAGCTRRMEYYVSNSTGDSNYSAALFDEANDPFQLKDLAQCHSKLKAESSKLKKELEPGLEEPQMGLSMALQSDGFRDISKEIIDCEINALLLMKTFEQLSKYYRKIGHPIRDAAWPRLHARFLEDALNIISAACECLKAAYPDGRLRAQRGNSVRAVVAAASFRNLHDVRLRTISGWSRDYAEFLRRKGFEGTDPVAIMTLGITATYILELCRHLQKAGKGLEQIAHQFPAII